jgi:hypothetical protein
MGTAKTHYLHYFGRTHDAKTKPASIFVMGTAKKLIRGIISAALMMQKRRAN